VFAILPWWVPLESVETAGDSGQAFSISRSIVAHRSVARAPEVVVDVFPF